MIHPHVWVHRHTRTHTHAYMHQGKYTHAYTPLWPQLPALAVEDVEAERELEEKARADREAAVAALLKAANQGACVCI